MEGRKICLVWSFRDLFENAQKANTRRFEIGLNISPDNNFDAQFTGWTGLCIANLGVACISKFFDRLGDCVEYIP